MRITKDSALWRAIVTTIQSIIGLIIYLYTNPEVLNAHPELVPIASVGAGVISFVLNLFRKDVKNF